MDFQRLNQYSAALDPGFPGISLGVPVPFFMTNPQYAKMIPIESLTEDAVMRDLEYFRRACPGKLRRMRGRVEEILDRLDYEGSPIYDEYPDELELRDIAAAAAKILAGELAKDSDFRTRQKQLEDVDGQNTRAISRTAETKTMPLIPGWEEHKKEDPAAEDYLTELSYVLVCDEIFRRRYKRKK